MKYLKSISMLLLLLPIQAMAQFAWYGEKGQAKVNTGMGNGTNTEGIWYSFTDAVDRGQSTITFSYPRSADNLPNDAHVKQHKGVKGKIALITSNCMYRLAGFGFNVAGKKNNSAEPCDATSWGGLSIGYSSDKTIKIELRLTDLRNSVLGYDYVGYYLPSTDNNEQFVRIPWSNFKQEGWGVGKITGPEAAKELAAICLLMNGDEGTYNFKITKIGSYYMQESPGVSTGITSPADAVDNDNWYTISGMQLQQQPTTPGVYIHNGVKMVVK